MSREVDPEKPQSNDDLLYLAQRDLLTDEWVEKLGGVEGVMDLLNGDKVVKIKQSGSSEANEEDEEEEEEETAAKPAARTATAAKK